MPVLLPSRPRRVPSTPRAVSPLPSPLASLPRRRSPLNIAHRGASAEAPENTLAAVRAAVARGADLVEVDVRRTRDGALVLLHDPTLERTTDAARVLPRRAPWRAADLTYDEIRRLDAGSWKAACFGGERVALLEEALAATAAAGVGLLVEVKADGAQPGLAGDVAAALRSRPAPGAGPGTARDGLVVQSFAESVARELKGRLPDVPVGLLGAPARGRLVEIATWADLVNPPHQRADRAYVDAVRQHGLRCLVWTVDATWSMRRSLRCGVDGIITNRPDRLQHLLR